MDFYIQASAILTKLDNKAGSIKGLTLHSGEKNGPRTYALILETLKYRDVLRQVITNSDLHGKERRLAAQGNLSLLLVHDLLRNKGGIVANAGSFKDAVMRHKTRLQAEWIRAKIKLKVKDDVQMAKVDATFIPRWARINTLKIEASQLMLDLRDLKVVKSLSELQSNCVYVDEHIPNLLAFHPEKQLTSSRHYLDGSLIFQNKASCIPAAILNPPSHASVIDACAAPGNKTSHLAAILGGTGSLFAFERDPRRVEVLRSMMRKSGSNVAITHGDFTKADPYDPAYAQVSHLLLDPSCSGSGIVNRLDYLTEPSVSQEENPVNDESSTILDQDRLDSLSSFQLALLLHAMKFPAAEKITYSTCSVHAVENEGVVMEALRKAPDWTVTRRQDTLPAWPHRGVLEHCHGDKEVAEGLIRAQPGIMGTIGFFVACFIKKEKSSKRRAEEPIFLADDGLDSDREGMECSISPDHAEAAKTTTKRKKKRKKHKKDQASLQDSSNNATTHT